MRVASLCAAVLIASVVVAADERSVLFDEDVDFSMFRSFALRNAGVTSDRPELSSPLVMQAIGDAIRASLVGRGLGDGGARADVVVEYSVSGVDFEVGPFGRPWPIEAGRGGRGGRRDAVKVAFTEATMVIDVKREDSRALVWRGVYRIADGEMQKLVDALPKNAVRLLSQYPPKRKGRS
jgi:hypothetical protein